MNCFIFFVTRCLKSGVYSILAAHLNLDTKFSLEIIDLYLEFIKFSVDNIESQNQIVSCKFSSN